MQIAKCKVQSAKCKMIAQSKNCVIPSQCAHWRGNLQTQRFLYFGSVQKCTPEIATEFCILHFP